MAHHYHDQRVVFLILPKTLETQLAEIIFASSSVQQLASGAERQRTLLKGLVRILE